MSRFSRVVPDNGTGNPNVKLLSAAWGDPFTGHVRPNAPGVNVQPAGLLSTAPYRDPLLASQPRVVPIYVDPTPVLPEPDDPEPYEPDDPEDGGPITEEIPIVTFEEPKLTTRRRRTHHITMPSD